MKGELVREKVDFDAAEAFPIEVGDVVHFGHVGGDDRSSNAARDEDLVDALVGKLRLAQPEVVDAVSEAVRAGVCSFVEKAVGEGLLPAEFGVPVREVSDRRGAGAGRGVGAVCDERSQHGVRPVAHLVRYLLDLVDRRDGKPRMVPQRHRNGGGVVASYFRYVCKCDTSGHKL